MWNFFWATVQLKCVWVCQHRKCAISFYSLFITRIEQSSQGAGSNRKQENLNRITKVLWRASGGNGKVKLLKSRDEFPFEEVQVRRYSKHNRTLTLHIQFKFVLQNSLLVDYCLASVIIFMRILFRDRHIEKSVVKGFGSLEAFLSSQLFPILFPNYNWRFSLDPYDKE